MSPALPRAMVRGRWLKAWLALALLTALLIGSMADAALSMVQVWLATTTYHHCFLVLPISAFLVWHRRAELRGLAPHQSPLALLPLLLCGMLWLIGLAGDIRLFQHGALVGSFISLVVAVFGGAIARAIAFPLAFLVFMVPAGDALIPTLQSFTASFAVGMLQLAGVPVFHDGIMIETPSGLFEVAEACAGVRFLIAMLMVGALFAHLALGSWRKRLVAMLVAAGLPILANGLRAFGIIYLAYLTDHAQAAGVDHLVYGWAFFALVMLMFLAIGSRFADPQRTDTSRRRRFASIREPWRLAYLLPLALVLAAPQLYARTIMAPAAAAPAGPSAGAMDDLALDLDCQQRPARAWQPRFAAADLRLLQSLACRGQPVDLFLALYRHQAQGAELIHHGNRLADGVAWKRISSGWHDPKIAGLPSRLRLEQQRGAAGERVVLAWYWIDGRLTALAWQAKLWQIQSKLLGRDAPAALIALSAPVGDSASTALASLRPLLRQHERIERYLDRQRPS